MSDIKQVLEKATPEREELKAIRSILADSELEDDGYLQLLCDVVALCGSVIDDIRRERGEVSR